MRDRSCFPRRSISAYRAPLMESTAPTRISRPGLVHSLDLAIAMALLLTVLLVPVSFLVPFNDEWLRINYLENHTLWEWVVMHSQTWVVRPTSEVIMGLAALPSTRQALAHDFTPRAFLASFQHAYIALALSYCALLWLNAVLIGGRLLALEETALVVLGALTCWLMSEELGFGFYWIDGYGNVLMPFVLLTSGMALLARSHKLLPLLCAAGLFVLAALGHEVLCIYALGVVGLCAGFRRPSATGLARWGTCAVLLLACGAILYAQLLSEGPSVNRAGQYAKATGTAYHYDMALQNVLQIKPMQALLSVLTPIFAVAIYRDQLRGLLERAERDVSRHRVFWALLACGTFLTSLLPLASVGLKKGRVNVALYSTLTHLFLVLLGFVLCPVVARYLEPLVRRYRQRVGSILPLLLLLVLATHNRESFQRAVVERAELKGQALSYITRLFEGPKRQLDLCRPAHPYVKKAKGLTDRGEAEYFHLDKVRHQCPKHAQPSQSSTAARD